MSNQYSFILPALLGFAISTISSLFFWRDYSRLRKQRFLQIQLAENELLTDFEDTSVAELNQTETGKTLLEFLESIGEIDKISKENIEQPNKFLGSAFDVCPLCNSNPCMCSVENNYSTNEALQNYSQKHYDVFLSYSTHNKDQAEEVFDFLTSQKISVFMGEKKIQPGVAWEDFIKNAIQNSKVLCILASPESLSSEWVNAEIGLAWALDIPTLPILYDYTEKDLPAKLQRNQSLNYREYPKIIDVLKELS